MEKKPDIKTTAQGKHPKSVWKARLFSFGLEEEKQYFLESLTMLLGSGMDMIAALRAAHAGVTNARLRRLASAMIAEVETGMPLWSAIEQTQLFPSQVISLLRIGEESGRLVENIQVIAIQQSKDRQFRTKIHSAMMYPVMVLVLTVVIGLGIAWFILPKLATVFDELHVELPAITRVLIWTGKILGAYGFILVPAAFAILALMMLILFVHPKTKYVGQALLFLIPGVRRLLCEGELARAGYVFGTLLQAGLPIDTAMRSLAEATTLHRYRRLYQHLFGQIEAGETFQAAFQRYPKSAVLVPLSIQQMIIAAERSGKLSDTFLKIGNVFEIRTETTMKNVSVVLEPILLVIVWLGVVLVALAVILPIYSLIGGFQSGVDTPSSPPPQFIDTSARETDDVSANKDSLPPLLLTETTDVGASTMDTEEPIPVFPQVTIADTGLGYLRVRQAPSLASEVLTTVPTGAIYSVVDSANGWYQITVADKTGWVSGTYVIYEGGQE